MTIDEDRGAEPVSAEEGLVAGRYELQQRIGRGAMADVHLAFDRELQREVAVEDPP